MNDAASSLGPGVWPYIETEIDGFSLQAPRPLTTSGTLLDNSLEFRKAIGQSCRARLQDQQ